MSLNENLIIDCVSIFNEITSQYVSKVEFESDIVVELQIELLESTVYSTNNSNLIDFEREVDKASIPELFFTVPKKIYFQPKIEYYIKPLQLKGASLDYSCYYSAYKGEEDELYQRWITLSKLIEIENVV